ncbi:hypothetical protein JST97_25315 [bacterium]|nr:hypothetical protein [bacterium]
MKIQSLPQANPNSYTAKSPATPPPPGPPSDQADLFQKAAGAVRGSIQAALFAGPGALAGWQAASGKPFDSRLRANMGWSGLGLGGACGYALAGPLGAGLGAAGAGIMGVFLCDFQWGETASQKVEQALSPVISNNPQDVRSATARKVRAARVGFQETGKQAFELGQAVGQGKVLGLERGLAQIPTVLKRDSSQGLNSLDATPRSTLRKVLGAPLGLVTGATAALGGAASGLTRDAGVGSGMYALCLGTAFLAIGSAAASLAVPGFNQAFGIAASGLGGLVGASLLTGAALSRTDGGERFLTRKYNDRSHSPSYEDYAEPSKDNIANRRQARIEGFTAGLKNGAIEGYEAGNRLLDPVWDGAAQVATKVAQGLSHIPEKLKGVWDGLHG